MATTSNYGWPTPDDTDLVRDGAAAIRAFGSAVDSTLVGIGKNVVQTVKTDVFTTTTSGYQAVTGLAVTITPSSDTSKVLVTGRVNIGSNQQNIDSILSYRLLRGATEIGSGTAVGNRPSAAASFQAGEFSPNSNSTLPIEFLDSPNTTDPTTYSIQVNRTAGITRVNMSYDDTDATTRPRTSSVITAIEVAA